MRRVFRRVGHSLKGLFLFVYWYAVGVTVLLYLLPSAALFIERAYDALGVIPKIILVLGIFSVAGILQILSSRED